MKKLDNKGLSLVELVIAISMATIVIGAATMFLYSAQRSYRNAEYSIDLQMEAQLLMEQMSNWVMESNYIDYGGASGSNYLVLYSLPRPDVDPATLDAIPLCGERKIIYLYGTKLYIKIDTETTPGTFLKEIQDDTLDPMTFLGVAPSEENCIGEYTQLFTVSLPPSVKPESINSVIIELGLKEGTSAMSQSYSVTNRFSLRNGMVEIEDE